MWALENRTPFAAERTWVRDQNGAEVWIVAVKGTFTVHSDGTTKVAEEQLEVCRVPKYRGEPGKSSLLSEVDLLHVKPKTDVLLNGHAYAPRGKPAPSTDVTMKVANISKCLRVFGDRTWQKSLVGVAMTDPEPFEKMPIIYERAFGGADQKSENPHQHDWERRNPVGTGFAAAAEHVVGQLAPNIEDPKHLISSWRERPRPSGFGPIARDWSPRVQLAGTYDVKWQKERLPLVPSDFDERFYQCAPEDQQVPDYLKGGEPVELANLTLDGLLRFNLPRVALGFDTRFSTGETVHHRATLHSVVLEPDVPRVVMVWHSALPCHPKVLKLLKTIVSQKQVLGPDTKGPARPE